MKLITKWCEGEVCIHNDTVSTLVIEHQELFLHFLQDLHRQIQGEEGDIILSEGNEILKISKMVDLTTSFVPFELNEKRLVTKINGLLEKEAMNELYFGETMRLLSSIERFVNLLSEILPCSLNFSGLNTASLIKMCGITIEDDSISDVERVFHYMMLVRDLLGEKLFVFANMRSFFTDEAMQQFVETVTAHNFYVLLIDNKESVKLCGEKRMIVDKDLCVIN